MVTGYQEDAGQDRMPDEAVGLIQDGTKSARFRLATGLFQRVRGLLGTKANKEILLLAPCKDIHTVGMRYAIDVAFIDQSGTVVLVRRGVGPGKRIACKKAVAVLERSADTQSAWYECGDVVLMGCASDAGRGRASDADRSCVLDGKGVSDEAEGEAKEQRGAAR